MPGASAPRNGPRPAPPILEIQVFQESWQHAKSWETTKTRPHAEVLQIGVVNPAGYVRWSEPRPMSPRTGSRHLL